MVYTHTYLFYKMKRNTQLLNASHFVQQGTLVVCLQ